MKKLDKKNSLFETLKQNPPKWWHELKKDEEIYMDIRKDNSIDVYYNGGAIITGLKHNGKNFSGKIHYKYLLPKKTTYINYHFDKNIYINQQNIPLLTINGFDSKTLKDIKTNIKIYYSASSEKGVQARFILKSGFFIDSEFSYTYNNKTIRCDLIWVDINKEKIIAVELKTIHNSELLSKHIVNQLTSYKDLISNYKVELEHYYQKVFQIKKDLGILPHGLQSISSLNGYEFLDKPLLLVGDCSQSWINDNAKDINVKIDGITYGAYYFGNSGYSCDLIDKAKRNQYIF